MPPKLFQDETDEGGFSLFQDEKDEDCEVCLFQDEGGEVERGDTSMRIVDAGFKLLQDEPDELSQESNGPSLFGRAR